jgi:hypothetical protein
MKRRYAISLFALTACQIGGPYSNPYDYAQVGDASGDVSLATEPALAGDDAAPASGDDAPAALTEDVGPASDDGGGGDDGGLGTGPGDGGGACSPAVAVCDPVHNTGCNALQQCDVNPFQATTPTGQCVLGGGAEGGACTVSIFNESCAPGSTCVSGTCRQLCFCNSDCPAGQCCSDHTGPGGFTLCRPCP